MAVESAKLYITETIWLANIWHHINHNITIFFIKQGKQFIFFYLVKTFKGGIKELQYILILILITKD